MTNQSFPIITACISLQLSEVVADDIKSESEKMPETVTEEKKGEEVVPETPKECRNIVLVGFGGLKMLKIQKKEDPKPGVGEVLIRVKAW